jgi:Cyclin, N-terminal domain
MARCWRFSRSSILNDSPSRQDGISLESEREMRRAGSGHIIALSVRIFGEEPRMKAPATTACVLFNRFFARHSFKKHDRWLVSLACFFLGCKIEEVSKRMKDVIVASWVIQHNGSKFPFTSDSNEMIEMRDRVADCERQVLYTLEFDVSVDQPYEFIGKQCRIWRDNNQLGSKNEKPSLAALLDRTSADLAFLAVTSELCLFFTSQEIAISCLYLGLVHLSKYTQRIKLSTNKMMESIISTNNINNVIIRAFCDSFLDLFQSHIQLNASLLNQDQKYLKTDTLRSDIAKSPLAETYSNPHDGQSDSNALFYSPSKATDAIVEDDSVHESANIPPETTLVSTTEKASTIDLFEKLSELQSKLEQDNFA